MSKKDIPPPYPKPKADAKKLLADKVKAANNGQTIQK